MNIFIQTSTNVSLWLNVALGEQENISMFPTCPKLSPRAPIPDGTNYATLVFI